MSEREAQILVVEDDPDVRESLAEILEDEGYAVAAAADGAQALRFLSQASALPRLILLDLMMPNVDAFEFRERQRAEPRLASVPVALLTADGLAAEKAERLGVKAHLRKPVRIGALLALVQELLPAT